MSRVCVPRFALRALALGGLAAALSVAPADAATVVLKVTDGSGDVANPALDLLGATITQDTGTGAVTASVVTAAAPTATGSILGVALGTTSGSTCNTGAADNEGLFQFLVTLGSPPSGAWLVKGDTTGHPISPSVTGTGIVATSGPTAAGKKVKWTCATISLQVQADGATVGDAASAVGAKTLPGAGAYVTTDLPDTDLDGVPNVADACPTVAGSRANGCLNLPATMALRLGAKRVVVDMMVKRTGSACPASVKLVATSSGKTVGKGSLTVGTHGSYCHLAGAVRTKRHAKRAKVKLSGSGIAKISRTLKAS